MKLKSVLFIISFLLGTLIIDINSINYNIFTDEFNIKLLFLKLLIYIGSYMIIDIIYGLIVKISKMSNL